LEENSHCLLKVPSWHFREGSSENCKKETSVEKDSDSSKIQTKNYSNTRLKFYHYTNLFSTCIKPPVHNIDFLGHTSDQKMQKEIIGDNYFIYSTVDEYLLFRLLSIAAVSSLVQYIIFLESFSLL
jgi:hypothetical protein